MDTIISTASSTFSTTMGFGLGDVTGWMADQLLLIIGSGLAVLVALLPYIIGLAILSAIVYFLYKAFRFFRH